MSALMGFGGQTVQGKPQEELMERVSLEWQIFGEFWFVCFFLFRGCDFVSCSLQYFHPDHLSSAEKMKLELKRVRDKLKMSENDCGSARVQGNLLTVHNHRSICFWFKYITYIALHSKSRNHNNFLLASWGQSNMLQWYAKLCKT